MELIPSLMTNKQATSYKKNDKTTVNKDSDDSNLIKRQSANSSMVKKEVSIIGDSMIKYVNGREVSRNDSVKVSHPGATTGDFIMSDPLFVKNLI